MNVFLSEPKRCRVDALLLLLRAHAAEADRRAGAYPSDQALFPHQGKELALVILLHWRQGHAQVILAEAHLGHGSLDGDGIDLAEQGVDQRQILQLQLRRSGAVSAEESAAHFRSLGRQQIAQHTDEYRRSPL